MEATTFYKKNTIARLHIMKIRCLGTQNGLNDSFIQKKKIFC